MKNNKNATIVYNEGYVAGYNQHRVDTGEMKQGESDKILRRIKDAES